MANGQNHRQAPKTPLKIRRMENDQNYGKSFVGRHLHKCGGPTVFSSSSGVPNTHGWLRLPLPPLALLG